ncbi:SRA stem-loop-interacting RNA-binding protein, mitochondrial-like [Diabrotica virgifera virgifera]|uniref:SRA stem-loop-interacting RNA-binding protein, mitochondrial-like n=1 Tax=Diabrotica virgifera virgifera TaxID=50390 RepID=A0A6P7GIS5_DIAVI|nr:SRA stem-loop-interacting RNA-binding protein, mitochondrial-like [Diabrotica virgifera virgifera]
MATNGVRQLYRLYVSNIPWTVGSKELRTYFSKFGHLQQATVVFDRKTGLSKNYGFITFSNREGLESATKNNLHKLEGNTIRVQPSNPEN